IGPSPLVLRGLVAARMDVVIAVLLFNAGFRSRTTAADGPSTVGRQPRSAASTGHYPATRRSDLVSRPTHFGAASPVKGPLAEAAGGPIRMSASGVVAGAGVASDVPDDRAAPRTTRHRQCTLPSTEIGGCRRRRTPLATRT